MRCILIGYKVAPSDGYEQFVGDPPWSIAGIKLAEPVLEETDEQRATRLAYEEERAKQADEYRRQQAVKDASLSELAEVHVVDLAQRDAKLWAKQAGNRTPLAFRVRDYLLADSQAAWLPPRSPQPKDPIVFIGFGIAEFFQRLRLECSMPFQGPDGSLTTSPLPFGDVVAYEAADLVLPTGPNELLTWFDTPVGSLPKVPKLPLREALLRRRIVLNESWAGPGNDSEADVRIVAELAAQHGLWPGGKEGSE